MTEDSRRTGVLVFCLFFLSGAFALTYEIAWARALCLHFGSTTLGVSTVLALFMGGLALGAWGAGGRADHLTRPLAAYGWIEIAVGAYALLTPLLFRGLFPLFDRVGPALGDSLQTVATVRFLAAAVLLLPPTALMGATLPVLCRHGVLRNGEGKRGAGLLYGVNTVGAFAGATVAGLVLLPTLGLAVTVLATGVCNVLLGFVAVLRARRGSEICRARMAESLRASAGSGAKVPGTEPFAPYSKRPFRVALWTAVALTGFAALVCEVAWTRVMELVLGGSAFAFTVVLATFLAGLGIGAVAAAALLRVSASRARLVFYGAALCAAATLCLSCAAMQYLPEFFRHLYWFCSMKHYPRLILPAQFLIAGSVMLLPGAVMGAIFPIAVRIAVGAPDRAGWQVGLLYAWNTAGAILGSCAAGFVLLPLIGVRGALLLAACAYCAAAALAAWAPRKVWRTALLSVGCAAVMLLALTATPPWHRHLMTSAMYQRAGTYGSDRGPLRDALAEREELLYYRDGLTTTVTVLRSRTLAPERLYICANGKVDGSSHGDMPTQRLCAHAPVLVHPAPRDVCVVGMGTGCTAGSAALHPEVRAVTVVEIESAMVEGARWFREHNHRVHENPKVDIRITDARLLLRLRPNAFDVISSAPSNPWLAGSSDLFTLEFFQLADRALRERGVFCQWVQVGGMSPANLRTIVRTFATVFPETYLLSAIPDTDALLLGSRAPLELDVGRIGQRMRIAVVRDDLRDRRVGIESVQDLCARFRMGPDAARSYAGEGPLHTDDLPIVAYRAPRDLYRDTRVQNMREIACFATGIGTRVTGLPSESQRQAFLDDLAAAYRKFLPDGKEWQSCR